MKAVSIALEMRDKPMLKPGLKDVTLEERRGQACPRIDHKKNFRLKIVSVIYGLKELSKRSVFCHETWSL